MRPLESIQSLDGDEDGKRDHQELEDRLQKIAVPEEHRLAGMIDGDLHGEIREVHAPQDRRQRRHDHVLDQRAHDPAEGGSDHDADRQVDDASPHGKFFEF